MTSELDRLRQALIHDPRNRDLRRRLRHLRWRLGLERPRPRTRPTPKDQTVRIRWHDQWRRTRISFSGKPLPDGYHRVVILAEYDQGVIKCLRSRSHTYVSVTALTPDQRTHRLEDLRLQRRAHEFMRDNVWQIAHGGFLIPEHARHALQLAIQELYLTPTPNPSHRGRGWIPYPEPRYILTKNACLECRTAIAIQRSV